MVVAAGPMGFIGIKRASVRMGISALFGPRRAKLKQLIVDEVVVDSPAARAGIRAHDKIVRIDGRAINEYSLNSLLELSQKSPGETIYVDVQSPHEHAPRAVTVIVGRKPRTNTDSSGADAPEGANSSPSTR